MEHSSSLSLSLASPHSSIHLFLLEKWLPDPRKISVKVMSDWVRLINRLVNSYCSAPGQMPVHGFQEPSNLSTGGKDDHPYTGTWISNWSNLAFLLCGWSCVSMPCFSGQHTWHPKPPAGPWAGRFAFPSHHAILRTYSLVPCAFFINNNLWDNWNQLSSLPYTLLQYERN